MFARDEIRQYAAHALNGLIINGQPNSDIISDELAEQAWAIGIAMMEQEKKYDDQQVRRDKKGGVIK